MTTLFKHQIEGIEFLIKNPKAILAHEMGLGKTKMAILAAKEDFKERNEDFTAIVVCPASLKINWEREIHIEYPNDKVLIISGSKIPRWIDEQWIVINFDILAKHKWLKERVDLGSIDAVILDEAHYIKGKSIRAKETLALVENAKRVYCLTGTPLLNRPIEMFNMLKAIKHQLGDLRSYYSKRYCGGFLQTILRRNKEPLHIWNEQGSSNLGELREQIKDCMLRRKKEDVLDLPEKIIQTMDCELDSEWKKTYDNGWDMYLDFLQKNPMPDKNIDNIIMARQLVEIQKLKQVCSQSKVSRIVADIRNAIEQDEKVIVFSQYTETIKRISETLTTGDHLHRPVKNRTLTGADDMAERQKAVDDFQNDSEVKVFIANIKAGGVGLNLTAASIVIFADMDWSPAIHEQAYSRAYRIGTKRIVNIYFYIIRGTIEEDIIDILNSKQGVMDKILEGTDDRVKTESMQQAFLQRIREKASCA